MNGAAKRRRNSCRKDRVRRTPKYIFASAAFAALHLMQTYSFIYTHTKGNSWNTKKAIISCRDIIFLQVAFHSQLEIVSYLFEICKKLNSPPANFENWQKFRVPSTHFRNCAIKLCPENSILFVMMIINEYRFAIYSFAALHFFQHKYIQF